MTNTYFIFRNKKKEQKEKKILISYSSLWLLASQKIFAIVREIIIEMRFTERVTPCTVTFFALSATTSCAHGQRIATTAHGDSLIAETKERDGTKKESQAWKTDNQSTPRWVGVVSVSLDKFPKHFFYSTLRGKTREKLLQEALARTSAKLPLHSHDRNVHQNTHTLSRWKSLHFPSHSAKKPACFFFFLLFSSNDANTILSWQK